MSVQPIFKLNETEAAFVQRYRDRFANLPGAGDAALCALRNQAMARFEAAGLPNRRVEDWKYTDLRRLLVHTGTGTGVAGDAGGDPAALVAFASLEPVVISFVNGVFDPSRSTMAELPEGVIVTRLSQNVDDWVLQEIESRLPDGANAVFDLNTALMEDGAIIDIAPGTDVGRPIVIADLVGAGVAAHLRHIVRIGEGARATLIEIAAGVGDHGQSENGLQTAALSLAIADRASLGHVKVQDIPRATAHLAPHVIEIGAEATLNSFTLSVGAGLAREERHVRFAGADSEGSISGAYIIGGSQHADTTLVVDHVEPGCTSREQFRAIIDDQANGVFQGLLRVAQKAQKTDARQSIDSLLLSDDAQHSAKPELEIYADDVQCAHGATNGELDDDALFYLRARGVPLAEAERVLINAFIAEGLEVVEDAALREILTGLAGVRLAERERGPRHA